MIDAVDILYFQVGRKKNWYGAFVYGLEVVTNIGVRTDFMKVVGGSEEEAEIAVQHFNNALKTLPLHANRERPNDVNEMGQQITVVTTSEDRQVK